MIWWEADRTRIVGNVVQTQRCRFGDQNAEDAATAWKVADGCVGLRIDAVRDEALESGTGTIDNAKSDVARSGDASRSFHDPLEYGIQRELGADRNASLDECSQTL
jgi:hypothetical protein